jgi:hypothetical protein
MRIPQPDLPPEHCQYRDEGCYLYPSCLECPLPCCIYDDPSGEGLRRRHKRARDQEVLHLYRQGQPAAELARSFGISERSIYRIVRRTLS